MITSYSKPQLTVRQLLDVVLPVTPSVRHACVLGPQFDLRRVTNADERAAMKGVLFAENTDPDPAARQLVPYENLRAGTIVDRAFTKLYAEDLEGQLWQANSPAVNDQVSQAKYEFLITSLATPNQVRVVRRGARIAVFFDAYSGQINGAAVIFAGSGYPLASTVDVPVTGGSGSGGVLRLTTDANGTVILAVVISPGAGYTANVVFDAPVAAGANVGVDDATLIPELRGRQIKAGDVVYTTFGDATVRRTVRRVDKENTPAKAGSAAGSNDGKMVASPLNPIQSEAASFNNPSAPPNWDVLLSHNSILKATITNAGTGYTSAPTVAISAPPSIGGALLWANAQALASATVVDGKVTAISIDHPGAGYVDGGVVTLAISNAGSGYQAVPTITIAAPPSGGIQAKAEAIVSGGQVTGYRIVEPGHGYTSAPAVSFSGGTPTVAAAATSTIASAPTITFSGGGGSNAAATAVLRSLAADWNGLKEGAIYAGQYGERYIITVVKGGADDQVPRVRVRSQSGGFLADNVVVRRLGNAYVLNHAVFGGLVPELRYIGLASTVPPLSLGDQFSFVVFGKYKPLELAAGGTVASLNILSGGTGYTTLNASIEISAPPSGGVQATATPTVTSGAISGYTITNPGSGYVYPPVVKVKSSGSTGSASASSEVSGSEAAKAFDGDLNTLWSSTADPSSVSGGEWVKWTFSSGKVITGYAIAFPVNNRPLNFVLEGSNNGTTWTTLDTVSGNTSMATAISRQFSNATSYTQIRVRATAMNSEGLGVAVPFKIRSFDLHTANGDALQVGYGAIVTANLATPAVSRSLTLVASGLYRGTADTRYQVTVVSSGNNAVPTPYNGAVVRITDSAGIDALQEITVTQGVEYPLGTLGLRFLFPTRDAGVHTHQVGLRKGDVFYVHATAQKANGAASILVLNGQAADTMEWSDFDLPINKLNVDVRALFTGELVAKRNSAPLLAYEAGTESVGGILVRDTLKLKFTDRDADYQWVPAKASPAGRLFAHYRALVPATSADTFKLYGSEADLITTFGKNDADNPVCHGAVIAFRAAQTKPVYVGRLASNDRTGYAAMLRKAERVRGIYAMALMTADYTIQQDLRTHCNKVSTEKGKLWRRGYIGTSNPGAYPLLDLQADGALYEAVILANGSGNVRVVSPGAKFLTLGVKPGDHFRTNYRANEWNDTVFDSYVVANVLEEDELLLETGPSAAVNPAVKFELWRPDNGLSQAEFIGGRSEQFLDRRVNNIWTDSPLRRNAAGSLLAQPLCFLAAEAAGLRSVLLPQQGLTRTQFEHSVTAAPLMFSKYSDEELDVAASRGTFIVTQELEDGPVFVRHQLTTDSNRGILYYEDSVGANLDDMSYKVVDILDRYVGRRNAVQAVVEEIMTDMRNLLDASKDTPSAVPDAGPQIVDYANLKVAIDPVLKDTIAVSVDIDFPLPLNHLRVTLRAARSLGAENTAAV